MEWTTLSISSEVVSAEEVDFLFNQNVVDFDIFLEEKINSLNWFGYDLVIIDEPSEEMVKSCNCSKIVEETGLPMMASVVVGERRVYFFREVLKRVKGYIGIDKALEFVRHENRHVQQFEFLMSIGGEALIEKVLLGEINKPYLEQCFEKDAFEYQVGIENSLEDVFSEYLEVK